MSSSWKNKTRLCPWTIELGLAAWRWSKTWPCLLVVSTTGLALDDGAKLGLATGRWNKAWPCPWRSSKVWQCLWTKEQSMALPVDETRRLGLATRQTPYLAKCKSIEQASLPLPNGNRNRWHASMRAHGPQAPRLYGTVFWPIGQPTLPRQLLTFKCHCPHVLSKSPIPQASNMRHERLQHLYTILLCLVDA